MSIFFAGSYSTLAPIRLDVAAATTLTPPELVALNISGDAVPASDTAGLRVIGQCLQLADNSAGAAGDIQARVAPFGVIKLDCTGLSKADLLTNVCIKDSSSVYSCSASNEQVVAGLLMSYTNDIATIKINDG